MARFVRKQKHEIGLSPDELLFRGKQKVDEVQLRVIDFDSENFEEKTLKTIDEILKYKDQHTITWFNVDGLHNKTIMEAIAKGFDLDKVILADVMHTDARPKVREFDNCIFLSIKMLKQDSETNIISVENLSIILTQNVIISFQERVGDVFEPIRDRIRKKKKKIRNSGPDYLLFALLDIVIDNYIYILGVTGEKVESLEDKLTIDQGQSILDEINIYKRELNFFRKNIKPAWEMILSLSKLESDFLNENTEIHFKELKDNINQVSDSSDSYREILSDQLNIYNTMISSKLNDIMKFLTIFSVIFIPLTFIAGIYGTNFDILPELHYKYSYFMMLGAMLVIAAGMIFYFRKQKWF